MSGKHVQKFGHNSAERRRFNKSCDELALSPLLREKCKLIPIRAIEASADFSRMVREVRFFQPSGPYIPEQYTIAKSWEQARRDSLHVAYHLGGVDYNVQEEADMSIREAVRRVDKSRDSRVLEEALVIVRNAVGDLVYKLSSKAAGEVCGYDQLQRLFELQSADVRTQTPQSIKEGIADGAAREARIAVSMAFLEAADCKVEKVKTPWELWTAYLRGDGVTGYVKYEKGKLLLYRAASE